MSKRELARHIADLTTWITRNEAFADELADLAADLKRDGRRQLAETVLDCSRNFRVRVLDLRGQLAAARPFVP